MRWAELVAFTTESINAYKIWIERLEERSTKCIRENNIKISLTEKDCVGSADTGIGSNGWL
jgi:hypothetical protein